MTNPDLEQLVEIIQKEFKKPGYGNVLWTKIAQAILDAGYVKAEKVWDGNTEWVSIGDGGMVWKTPQYIPRHIKVYVREVKELE